MVLGRFFTKIRQGLSKTRNVFGGIVDLFTGNRRVDKVFLLQLEEQLLLADVGVEASMRIVERVRQAYLDREVGEDVKLFVRSELREMLSDPEGGIRFQASGPTVVMTRPGSLPKSLSTRNACVLRTSIDLSSGVFLSSASPVQDR